MKLLYKKRVWKLICPETLGDFPPGVIRNILIENEQGLRIITNIKQIKPLNNKLITSFF